MSTQSAAQIPQMVSFTDTYHHKPYPAISPSRPELSASGKNVFITGGGTGIGKAIAKAFVQADAKSVTVVGRRENVLQETKKELEQAATESGSQSKVFYFVVDLNIREQIDQAFTALTKNLQGDKIQILVSNAGFADKTNTLDTIPMEIFMETFQTNVRGALNLLQSFVGYAAVHATLINTSTGMAHMAPIPTAGAYAVGKAANLKMVDYFAAENPDLHVVSFQPGIIITELSMRGAMDIGPMEFDELDLPGQFAVWLASPEAKFLKSKFVWANWDVDELRGKEAQITSTKQLTWIVDGVPM